MAFYYHMYGATIGSLQVQMSEDSSCDDLSAWTTVWSKNGEMGYAWQSASINSFGSNIYTCLRFYSVSGSSYTGDIAIDEVTITTGATPTPLPTISEAPTTR